MAPISPPSFLLFLESQFAQSLTSFCKVLSGNEKASELQQQRSPSVPMLLQILPAYKICTAFAGMLKQIMEQHEKPMVRKGEVAGQALTQGGARIEIGNEALLAQENLLGAKKEAPQEELSVIKQFIESILSTFESGQLPPALKEIVEALKQNLEQMKPNLSEKEAQKVLDQTVQNLLRLPQALRQAPEFAQNFLQTLQQRVEKEGQSSFNGVIPKEPVAQEESSKFTMIPPKQENRVMEQLPTILSLEKFQETVEKAMFTTQNPIAGQTAGQILQESNQLPLALVVPYAASYKSESRPSKAKRKKTDEEEIYEEEEDLLENPEDPSQQ